MLYGKTSFGGAVEWRSEQQLGSVSSVTSGQLLETRVAGDTPFSWRSLGVNVRGRSSTLRINYRTSHHIRRQGTKLLESLSGRPTCIPRESSPRRLASSSARPISLTAPRPQSELPDSSPPASGSMEARQDHVGIAIMHAANALEFRAVAVIACDDDIIPLESRLAEIADEADLEDVYST